MKLQIRAILFSLVACCAAGSAVSQSVIVTYTFNSDSLTADTGSSISGISWNSGGTEGYASTFSGSGRALSVNGFQIGEYFQITLDTSGYESITLDGFRTNGTTSAPKDWAVSYSTSGTSGSFTQALTYSIVSTTASGDTELSGFSLPSAADNNSSVVLRFIATSSSRVDGGGSLANGTARLDNIVISAVSAVPEPSTYAALLGLGALGLAASRRRSRNAVALVG